MNKTMTIKKETFTAIVTAPNTKDWSYIVTKGTATTKQVRRAMKRAVGVKRIGDAPKVKAVSEKKVVAKPAATK